MNYSVYFFCWAIDRPSSAASATHLIDPKFFFAEKEKEKRE
jgi:hypothetical protein